MLADFTSAVEEMQRKIAQHEVLQVESVSEDRYAYQTLTETQQQVYDELVYAFTNREESFVAATTDSADIELAYLAVTYDYCHFFWVTKISYVTYSYSNTEEVSYIEVSPEYAMTLAEQEETQAQIDAEVERLLADAPWEGSDYDKALYVYETLIQEVDYVEGSADNQTIIGAFLNHETICKGYAYATQYLLEQLGMSCTTVSGDTDGTSHAWNLVVMDGCYYYMDTTWGNSQYIDQMDLSNEEISGTKYVNYDYFGVTTALLSLTHTVDERIPLPECVAMSNNYYVHEGLYVDTWNVDWIASLIRESYHNGDAMVRIRFSDTALCAQAYTYFLEEGHVFDYCSGLTAARYIPMSDYGVMVILFSGD